jgi:hypothetical protein
MKTIIKIALASLAVAALIFGITRWNQTRKAEACINQMRQWEAAAESYCLAEKYGPTEILKLEDLSAFVKHGMAASVCPLGKQPYAPFSVGMGPVCPNGHDLAPGEVRPFRAEPGSKLAGIYEYAKQQK